MSTNEIFKTEFKGYSKKEVLDYIKTLNTQAESLEQELMNTQKELNRCKEELNEINQGFVSGQSKEEMTEQVRDEIEQSLRRQLYDEIKKQVESEIASGVGFDRNVPELEQLKSKAALYDEQKDVLAELIIKGKTDAAKIYAEAESKSCKIMEDALDKFEKMREDFEQMRKNVILSRSEIDARMATITRYLNDFTQYFDIMERDIENTRNNFKKEIESVK